MQEKLEKGFGMMGNLFFSCLDYTANDYSKMEIVHHIMKKNKGCHTGFHKLSSPGNHDNLGSNSGD